MDCPKKHQGGRVLTVLVMMIMMAAHVLNTMIVMSIMLMMIVMMCLGLRAPWNAGAMNLHEDEDSGATQTMFLQIVGWARQSKSVYLM